MNIEFTCVNCGASLKVLQAFGGKTIQCPKCLKKTVVPASPEPAASASPPSVPAPPPAASAVKPSPKPAAGDGIYIAFACEKCAASLKVLKSLAGKTIQCPKCSKKTAVPGGARPPAAPGKNAAPPPPAVSSKPPLPAVPPPPPPKTPSFAGAVPAAAPDEALAARVRDLEQKLEHQTRDLRTMEQRLDVARLRMERAEQEKQELAARKSDDRGRLEAELSAHFQAELEAARKTIARMEEKVQQATVDRLQRTKETGRTAVEIEKALLENPDDALTESETLVPDAVLSDIRESRFGRYIRLAIVIHAVVLGLTSIVYIRNRISPPPPPDEAGGASTNAVPAVASPVPAGSVPETGTSTGTGEVSETGTKVSVPAPSAAAPASALEALPEPGEKAPTDTQVDLGL